ncbi:MAG: peptidase M20, partial [Candidatus Margulisiibacteriota bacterium]
MIKKELKQLGIKYKQDKIGNIVAHVKGSAGNVPAIMLNAHLDTVTHKGNIKPKISKGFVRSDGTT